MVLLNRTIFDQWEELPQDPGCPPCEGFSAWALAASAAAPGLLCILQAIFIAYHRYAGFAEFLDKFLELAQSLRAVIGDLNRRRDAQGPVSAAPAAGSCPEPVVPENVTDDFRIGIDQRRARDTYL